MVKSMGAESNSHNFLSAVSVLVHPLDSSSQLAFPEFHFEIEAKVDFPSACI